MIEWIIDDLEKVKISFTSSLHSFSHLPKGMFSDVLRFSTLFFTRTPVCGSHYSWQTYIHKDEYTIRPYIRTYTHAHYKKTPCVWQGKSCVLSEDIMFREAKRWCELRGKLLGGTLLRVKLYFMIIQWFATLHLPGSLGSPSTALAGHNSALLVLIHLISIATLRGNLLLS